MLSAPNGAAASARHTTNKQADLQRKPLNRGVRLNGALGSYRWRKPGRHKRGEGAANLDQQLMRQRNASRHMRGCLLGWNQRRWGAPFGPMMRQERPRGTSNVSSRTSVVPSGALSATRWNAMVSPSRRTGSGRPSSCAMRSVDDRLRLSAHRHEP